MTFASHPERQFMQHLRGAGWIKARTLPLSVRTVKSLLQKGWIEKQYQGPNNEAFLRLTEKGLEAKKSPVPIEGRRRMVELGLKAKGK
jgi:DNA-binding MarR family transcriptional regulator